MISRRAGFTVIELMITISIIGILAAISAPSLRDLVRNARMTSLANDMMTDLSLARGEAVKRGVSVTICTSTDGANCTATAWPLGWIVFAETNTAGTDGRVDTGEIVVKISPQINGANENPPTNIASPDNSVQAGAQYITFRPTGVTKPGGAGVATNFLMCDARRTDLGVSASEALNKGRHITVIPSGRAQVTRCTCDSVATCAP